VQAPLFKKYPDEQAVQVVEVLHEAQVDGQAEQVPEAKKYPELHWEHELELVQVTQ